MLRPRVHTGHDIVDPGGGYEHDQAEGLDGVAPPAVFPGPPPGTQRTMPKPYLIQTARASEPLR